MAKATRNTPRQIANLRRHARPRSVSSVGRKTMFGGKKPSGADQRRTPGCRWTTVVSRYHTAADQAMAAVQYAPANRKKMTAPSA